MKILVRGRFLSQVSDIATIDGKNLREDSRLYKFSKFLLRERMFMCLVATLETNRGPELVW